MDRDATLAMTAGAPRDDGEGCHCEEPKATRQSRMSGGMDRHATLAMTAGAPRDDGTRIKGTLRFNARLHPVIVHKTGLQRPSIKREQLWYL